MKNIFVTGGGGFIGSNFIREILHKDCRIINLDLITYAASRKTLKELQKNKNYIFIKGDIGDLRKTKLIFSKYKPDCLINFAAETHVDRSIDNPSEFVNTNILGVFNLLKSTLDYLKKSNKKNKFKFIQVSTDEVYGSVKKGSSKEDSLLIPNSPYAASKTSADHLIFSFFKTYNFPSIITRSSNNYGPYQFPEKLIPLIILNALQEKKLPIYGNGEQVRNWLYVKDNAKALYQIYLKGRVGNTYNIGGNEELTNIKLVLKICKILDAIFPRKKNKEYRNLIKHVEDRPGHDKRYSLDSSKINKEIGWKPAVDIESGLFKTINWYLNNKTWWQEIIKFKYKGQRLGKKQK
tara:strand:+ start:2487 stop:3536 length:1050 start_codon:yes stop_codon:yes gene_type:complete